MREHPNVTEAGLLKAREFNFQRYHYAGIGRYAPADAYARGWQAAIDGRPAPLARADAAFRAVPVGPGAHTVRFTYRPQTFSVGVAVSALACAVWLVLLLGHQLWAISPRPTADRPELTALL